MGFSSQAGSLHGRRQTRNFLRGSRMCISIFPAPLPPVSKVWGGFTPRFRECFFSVEFCGVFFSENDDWIFFVGVFSPKKPLGTN